MKLQDSLPGLTMFRLKNIAGVGVTLQGKIVPNGIGGFAIQQSDMAVLQPIDGWHSSPELAWEAWERLLGKKGSIIP